MREIVVVVDDGVPPSPHTLHPPRARERERDDRRSQRSMSCLWTPCGMLARASSLGDTHWIVLINDLPCFSSPFIATSCWPRLVPFAAAFTRLQGVSL